jgi:[acyl-carrier-protein] S-malonyltransferase
MGRDLAAREPAARAFFDEADRQLGFPLSRLCFEGPHDELTATVNQQPALLVTSVATWAAMVARNWQPPDFVAGHSAGEFAALVVAGSLSFADGLALIRRRGELMQAAGESQPGGMAALLALDAPVVTALCEQASATTGRPVQLANDNCPGQVVISGDTVALEEAIRLAETAGARKVVRLPITIAAHSALMVSAAADFARAVEATPIATPRMPVIGNASAQPMTTAEQIRADLKAQLTAPVRWTETIRYLLAQGVDTFVEVGPGDVLQGLVKRIDRGARRLSLNLDEQQG